MAAERKHLEAFLKEAERVYEEIVCRAGPGSGDTLDDIEEQAEHAGSALALKLLRDRLAAEAAAEPPELTCPQCGRRMRQPKRAAARHQDTACGAARYERRHAICDGCGSSFSPSGPPAEDSAAGGVEPPSQESVRGQPGGVV